MIKRLFTSIDIASLVFFRIVFGILAFADIMGLFTYYHLWEGDFQPDKFHFKYYGFEWVEPLPEPFMSIFFLLLLSAAVLVTIGYKYRASATFLFFGFTYVFLLDKVHYLNHGYLFCWLSFVMIFIPANRAFSKDVAVKNVSSLSKVPYYNVFILQFFMGVVYFFGGLAKINSDWLIHAMPLKMWVGYKADMPILGALWAEETTAYVMSWAGMLLDLLVVFFLLFRNTRLWALGFVLFFHLTNSILFKIGIFPWLSIGLTLLYFPPSCPRLWLDWLANKFAFIKRIEDWWFSTTQEQRIEKREYAEETWTSVFAQKEATTSVKKWILLPLVGIIIFHLIMPLRQHIYDQPTAWTEQGHRYSWRMMLRQKVAFGYFLARRPNSKQTERIHPKDYLTKEQARKMQTHPDMILEFAHHIKRTYEAKGWTDVKIYANIRCALNGRAYQQYTDNTVDLVKEEWSFYKATPWIIPFENGAFKQMEKK